MHVAGLNAMVSLSLELIRKGEFSWALSFSVLSRVML